MFGTSGIEAELAELRIELRQGLERLSEQLAALIRLEQERVERERGETSE